MNVFATPYQVKDTAKTAAELAPLLKFEREVVKAMDDGSSGFAYVAHEVDLPTAAKIKRLHLPGVGWSRPSAASTRRETSPPR